MGWSTFDPSVSTNVPGDASCECCNCGWKGSLSECEAIADPSERIGVGEVTPAGQCPECSCLAHLDGDLSDNFIAASMLLDELRGRMTLSELKRLDHIVQTNRKGYSDAYTEA